MSAHTESDQEVQGILNCVALFYEQGKSGSSFLRKDILVRAKLQRGQILHGTKVSTVRSCAGLSLLANSN